MKLNFALDILKYCINDTFAFRAKKREIREICEGDQSLLNIYKAIQFFAENPENLKIKDIPIQVLKENISRTNKYAEDLTNFNSETKISNGGSFKIALQEALADKRATKIQEIADKISEDYVEGNLDKIKEKLKQIHLLTNASVSPISPEEVMGDFKVHLQQLKSAVIETGFFVMNEIADGGFRKGQIWNFGGKSGIGKTWFAANVSLNIIKFRPVYLSNEMNRNEILTRMLAISTKQSERRIEEKGLEDDNIAVAAELISENISIHELCHTIERIESIVEYEVTRNGKLFFILDHFHNMYAKKISEGEMQSYLAHELQRIAQQYGIILIVLHQVSKANYGENEATFKGRADSIETCNYGFILTLEPKVQEQFIPAFEREWHKIFTVTPIKVRRGVKKKFYLEQDFHKGGLITEPDEVTKQYNSYPKYEKDND